MERIDYLPVVRTYLEDLILTLFEKEYFGFKDSAKKYVSKLIDYIDKEALTIPHKTSPRQLSHLGKYYFIYRANNLTTWYIFLEKDAVGCIITFITNNHTPLASEFNL